MRAVWKMVNEMDKERTTKYVIYILIMVIINASAGGLLWAAAGRLILPSTQWLLCFIGYPAVFTGFFGGIVYLFNHDFS